MGLAAVRSQLHCHLLDHPHLPLADIPPSSDPQSSPLPVLGRPGTAGDVVPRGLGSLGHLWPQGEGRLPGALHHLPQGLQLRVRRPHSPHASSRDSLAALVRRQSVPPWSRCLWSGCAVVTQSGLLSVPLGQLLLVCGDTGVRAGSTSRPARSTDFSMLVAGTHAGDGLAFTYEAAPEGYSSAELKLHTSLQSTGRLQPARRALLSVSLLTQDGPCAEQSRLDARARGTGAGEGRQPEGGRQLCPPCWRGEGQPCFTSSVSPHPHQHWGVGRGWTGRSADEVGPPALPSVPESPLQSSTAWGTNTIDTEIQTGTGEPSVPQPCLGDGQV